MAINALLDLAWVAMPEEHIVGKLAAKCRRRRLHWDHRGSKGTIRDVVKNSRPPRGFKAKRLKAVITEIDRQAEVATKRGRNTPIDWSRRKLYCGDLDSRRLNVLRRLLGSEREYEYRRCASFKKWKGFRLFLVGKSGWYGARYLHIIRPDRSERVINLESNLRECDNIFKLVIHRLGNSPFLTQRAIMEGGKVAPDFDLCQTVITWPNGKEQTLPWEGV